jgi:penicillin-binding protein 2
LDENGKPVVSAHAQVDADLRFDFGPQDIELIRRGLWKVVNEDGGTGGRARLSGVQVAGKTGTAQGSTNGQEDTVAWFCCFAPYENPKYVIVVMVQAGQKGGHGGSVAAPIATRILERTLAMDEGKFEPQLAWLAPAHKANAFQTIAAIDYKDSGPNLGSEDEENADADHQTDAQMAPAGADPDVEQPPDAQGQVSRQRGQRVMRAQPVAPPPQQQQRPRNFFERLFGVKRQPQAPPQPQPAPNRRQQRKPF